MKKRDLIIRYYFAGAMTPVSLGLLALALGYGLGILEVIIGGWFLLLLGLFLIGPVLVMWYWKDIEEKAKAQ